MRIVILSLSDRINADYMYDIIVIIIVIKRYLDFRFHYISFLDSEFRFWLDSVNYFLFVLLISI